MNSIQEKRACLTKREMQKEGKEVVKGTARRVIVVRSPDPDVFDEAIFLVKEEYMRSPGVTQAQLLSEARKAASGYLAGIRKSKKKSKVPLLMAASGIGGSGIAVALMLLLA